MNEKDESKVKAGIARAESLSEDERKGIASTAAKARWEKEKLIPKATHMGELKIGNLKIPCAVLDNGIRVLSESGIASAMGSGGNRSGGSKRKKAMDALEGRAPLPVFMNSTRLEPFIYRVFGYEPIEPIRYKIGRKIHTGYAADHLPKVCDVWLTARDAGALQAQQQPRAKQAELLMRGLAHIGIIALVDEATGYQDIRDRQALQKILDKYITDELAKWTKTFPDEFYKELFRLKGLDYPTANGKKPSYVGHWTNDIIYDRLAPGVKAALKKKNPRHSKTGARKHKHHQYLTKDYGHPELKELLSNVIFMMRACNYWDQFKQMLDKTKQKYGSTIEMDV